MHPEHHPRRDIEQQGQPGTADRQPMDTVDQMDIDPGVVDLHPMERQSGLASGLHRIVAGACRLAALTRDDRGAFRPGGNPGAHGGQRRPRQLLPRAVANDLPVHRRYRRLLALKIAGPEMFGDHLLDLDREPTGAGAGAGWLEQQTAGRRGKP